MPSIPAGAITTLGPVVVADGLGTFAGTTPLSKFMIVASPEATLATYDPNTKVFFRSAVPAGFAVIPHTMAPVGEKVVATTATPGYSNRYHNYASSPLPQPQLPPLPQTTPPLPHYSSHHSHLQRPDAEHTRRTKKVTTPK